jgi:putative transposase
MPRTARIAPGGMVFHVLNRAIARVRIFEKEGDYAAFERTVEETLQQRAMRICAYCLMPNHWHFLLWPERDGDLAAFMQRLTISHVRNWQEHRQLTGTGHLYQARYKSFPVENDEHFLSVARYVESNPLRARLVSRAEDWRWSSRWRRSHGTSEQQSLLSAWPVAIPSAWPAWVNEPENEKQLEDLRDSVQRGRPYGQADWQQRVAKQLRLESAYRRRGRPRKLTNC